MIKFNCKNITKAISNSKKLLDIAKSQIDSGEVDEAKKNLEAAEKLTLIGPLKYKKFDRLASTIFSDLKPGEYVTGKGEMNKPIEDLVLSSDGTKITAMFQESARKIRYFDLDPNTWEYTQSRDIIIDGYEQSVLSRDGESIIVIKKAIINGRDRYVLDVINKISNETKLPVFTNLPDKVLNLAESIDGNKIYLVYDDGNAEIIDKQGTRIEKDVMMIKIKKMFDLEDGSTVMLSIDNRTGRNYIGFLDPNTYENQKTIDLPLGETIRGCINSMKKDELIYFTSKRMVIKNLKTKEEKQFCECERKFIADESEGQTTNIFGEEFHPYQLNQIAESHDGFVLFGIYDDGTVVVWDRMTGRKIKEIGTNRHGVNFEKMQLLPDGSIGIGGTEGFAEKWGLPEGVKND